MIDRETCVKKKANKRIKILKPKYEFFTRLKSTFFFSIKRASKIISKGSIYRAILTQLAAISNLFSTKINSILSSRNRGSRLKKQALGYVLILTIAMIPVILFGAKYIMDLRTMNEFHLNNGEAIDYQKLVNDVALTIARNWNPGLTLEQQRDAIFKVADEKYNESASTGLLSQAIPRLDISHWKKSNQPLGTFEPLKVERVSSSITRLANYQNAKKYVNRYSFTNSNWNPNFAMWRTIDQNTDPENRVSKFDEMKEKDGEYVLEHQDIFKSPEVSGSDKFIITTPNTANDYATYPGTKSYSSGTTPNKETGNEENYQLRESANYMGVSIANDKIKVEINGFTGYAVPNECNVDIVLAVPVNGASSNSENQDAASTTEGSPTLETSTTTPIYQMGQACKNFVKDNFYNTRGVTMGLIPYSAKVSIAPDQTKIDDYTIKIPSFVEQTQWTNPYHVTAAMYGTKGVKDAALVQSSYDWNTIKTGCPIMCRRGSTTTYNSATIFYGNLLSNVAPSDGEQYKYLQMNLNPCLAGYANQLSMKCERQCTTYLPNPYYMIEPTADMVKIYEMCNALYPIDDPNNVSNFLFIPFEWANNFWQSWTNDVTTSASTDTLSRPSKTTSGRKKVLVMLVNKPDWFEPGEMTYLGFDNDYSAVPLAESDKIDFSINYSDTSKKFLDGTAYDGTPRGPKKIIRYATQSGTIARNSSTGDFECTGSGTGRLYIPRQAMVRLTVKNREGGGDIRSGNLNWKYYSQALNPSGSSVYQNWGYYTFAYPYYYGTIAYLAKIGRFLIVAADANSSSKSAYTAYSDNGINWTRVTSRSLGIWALTATNDYFVGSQYDYITYSPDGINWYNGGSTAGCFYEDISWDGSKLFATNNYTTLYTTTATNGSGGWNSAGSVSQINSQGTEFKYGGGYYIRLGSQNSNILRSSSSVTFSSYSSYTLPLSRYSSISYGPGYWVILTQYGDVMCSTDASASNWSIIDGSSSNTTSSSLYKLSNKTSWMGLCYGGGKWVAFTYEGDVAVLEGGSSDPGTIKFTNIGNTTTYTIRDEKTFTIPASSVTSTSGDEYYVEFNVSNLKLISAEVTNLNYTYVNPINTSYNEVEMIGPGGSSQNLSWGTRSVSVSDRYIYQTSNQTSNGNFYISTSGLTSYNSSYGYYPSSKDSQKSVTVYSDTNQPVTLYFNSYTPNSSSGGSGSITFYSDNGVSENVGTYTVSGTKTFTFSGANWSKCTSTQDSSTWGPNFSQNLSVYKVRYSLNNDNTSISSCTLKNQVIRHYLSMYSWTSAPMPLILNTGESISDRSSCSCATTDSRYRDTCLCFTSGGSFVSGCPRIRAFTIRIYGMKKASNLSIFSASGGATFYYLASGGSEITVGTSSSCAMYSWDISSYVSYYQNNSDPFVQLREYKSSSDDYRGVFGIRVKNYYEKSFIQNITDSDLEYNRGVGLKKLTSAKNSIPAGNWICFQGDGQLEVTVKSNGETYNTPYVKIPSNTSGSYNSYNLSTSHGVGCSYTIPSSAFTWDESNQRYYTNYPVYLYNASLRQVYQPGTTISYPILKANANYSMTYSYNKYSGSRVVTTGSTSSTESGYYYLQLPRMCTPKFAARKYSVTEAVYDMIDFSANTTSSKNGYLSSSFGDSYSCGFYYVSSSSVNRTLTTSRKGRLELKVAPSFYADSGYIKMNYGSDTSAKTITAPTTLSMKYSDLSSGTMQFTLYNCVILYAKLCDAEATIGSPNYSDSRNMMWNSSSVSASNISLSGGYSNWSADEGWHRLTNSSFLTWNDSYCSDITSVLDAKSPIFAYWYMPQNVYTDYANTNLVGPMRLFAPITRDSTFTPRKYCQMYAYSSDYSNKANLLWHNFTLPYNHVLYRAGYHSAGGDTNAALRSATAAVCAKLKTDYGSNLRVYIVKYRKQAQYKTFPVYNVTQSDANHDYSVIDACATSSSYVYDISTEADLKTTLNTIAADIKSFAGGVTAARNVD